MTNFCRLVVVALMLCGLSTSCAAGEIPPEYKNFFSLPASQERREFRKYPLEKQIDIHLIAATYFRPPKFGFSYDIAAQGKEAIPALLSRLKAGSSEAYRGPVIYVFRVMVKFYYDFRDETEITDTLKTVVSSMKDPFYREESERLLKEILSEPKKEGARVP